MPNQIRIEQGDLIIAFTGIDCLLALRRQIVVPISSVRTEATQLGGNILNDADRASAGDQLNLYVE